MITIEYIKTEKETYKRLKERYHNTRDFKEVNGIYYVNKELL